MGKRAGEGRKAPSKQKRATPGRGRPDSGMCDLGHPAYRSKAEAEKANPGAKVKRCGRCRQWRAA